MGCCALVFHRAILLDHLIDLVPQVIRLFGKRLAHGHIRGRDGVARRGMLGQESEFRDTFLALNPAGDRHGVLLQDLLGDQVRAIALREPLPRLGIDFHGNQILAVLLLGCQVCLGWRQFLAMQINGGIIEIQHRQFALSRIPFRDVVGKRLFLAACADARAATICPIF